MFFDSIRSGSIVCVDKVDTTVFDANEKLVGLGDWDWNTGGLEIADCKSR
jgi:hypothetical protein